jgi:acyl-coenzyme A thioesterase PaaI-like protein
VASPEAARRRVWEASITSADGKLVAKGSVRLLCLDQSREIAGSSPEGKLK